MQMFTIKSSSEEYTYHCAMILGELIDSPLSIGLIGDLGAGKTKFVQGLAYGLGIKVLPSSPTFILFSEYDGRVPMLHGDLYRVEENDLENLDIEGQIEDWGGVSVVEWANLFPEQFPLEMVWIEIKIREPSEREIAVRATFDEGTKLISSWLSKCPE